MENFIVLDQMNLDREHICCAISDKKSTEGTQLKKEWLRRELDHGYVFRRLDARAKVFMEYGPAAKGWVPVLAPDYLLINCFWVAGQYKGKGYAKQLLQMALEDAKERGYKGLVTVAGTRKFHFMSDTKWLLKQGFTTVDQTSSGFSLLVYKIEEAENPQFNESVKTGCCKETTDLTVYYSNRCPFSELHVQHILKETAKKRNLSLTIVKLECREQAQQAPSPATIFSLFYRGKFVTTDISACLDNRLDKALQPFL
ncbi:N-acetyltransferase [Myroides sp. WP-1]|uniref:N-acetyltransferase n=1 Tax=Myroides sp. WP-1 TaxID=2759944 RepID=UPI0015F81BB3|nr:N-acetyltransferase [Myroides sp. WP-1]MBB1138993.1 GNAT family N-acetyltransferase [Myroides sp. WP-1]